MKFRHFFFFFGDESFDEHGVKHGVQNEASEAWRFLRPVLLASLVAAAVALLACGGVFAVFFR